MQKHLWKLFQFGVLFICSATIAQSQAVPGEVIPNFGSTYPVEDPDFPTAITEEYKVLFDVGKAPEDPAKVNRSIETVARFLNMHASAGKPLNTLEVFMVMHGEAAYSLLQNQYYKERYETNNPNIELLKALADHDVKIVLCGQTAVHRNITEERRIPETKTALSAMTALIQLQNDGYRLINF